MSYKIDFSKEAQKVVKKWKKSNPALYKKLVETLDELVTQPRTGLGHPEALKGGNDIGYSRHISAHNRIIYDIYDDIVCILVVKIEGHYKDK